MGGKNGKQSAELGPHLFKIGRVVGRGSFGKVYVIILRHNKKMFAMKQLAKKDIIERNMVDSIMNEKIILADLHFPFITNIYFCYQTETHLHMVMDLMMGGDVGFHLGTCGKFDEERSRFYAACVLLSLEYLHNEKKIIHRDLKPGNFLLDSDGYCHISDFNVSTTYNPEKPPTSCSGTKRYMAPEVLQRKQYDFAVDIWSYGVCIYEFITGKTPWSGREFNEDQERLNAMLNEPLKLSSRLSKDAASMLQLLLAIDPNARPKVSELRNLPYFKTIDWNDLINKKIVPSFVPEKNRAYINVNHDLEDQLVPEKKRKVTPEENQNFVDWDYVRDGSLFLPPPNEKNKLRRDGSNTSVTPKGNDADEEGDSENNINTPSNSSVTDSLKKENKNLVPSAHGSDNSKSHGDV